METFTESSFMDGVVGFGPSQADTTLTRLDTPATLLTKWPFQQHKCAKTPYFSNRRWNRRLETVRKVLWISRLLAKLDTNRTMVRTKSIGANESLFQSGTQRGGDEK